MVAKWGSYRFAWSGSHVWDPRSGPQVEPGARGWPWDRQTWMATDKLVISETDENSKIHSRILFFKPSRKLKEGGRGGTHWRYWSEHHVAFKPRLSKLANCNLEWELQIAECSTLLSVGHSCLHHTRNDARQRNIYSTSGDRKRLPARRYASACLSLIRHVLMILEWLRVGGLLFSTALRKCISTEGSPLWFTDWHFLQRSMEYVEKIKQF